MTVQTFDSAEKLPISLLTSDKDITANDSLMIEGDSTGYSPDTSSELFERIKHRLLQNKYKYSAGEKIQKDDGQKKIIREYCQKCIRYAESIMADQDKISREVTFSVLVEDIRDLLNLRNYREKEFGKLIFLLLSALDHSTSEDFTDIQVRALYQAIYPLKRPKIAKNDVSEARKALQNAGFDIFRMLRGVFNEEELLQESLRISAP